MSRSSSNGPPTRTTDTNGLLVITQVDPISVIFTVAEDDLPAVLRKLAAGDHLRAEVYGRSAGRVATMAR